MTKDGLSLDRFRALAEAYGSDLERWPEQERELGRRLLRESEAAREIIARERGLDTLLSATAVPAVPAKLMARLAELPVRTRAPRRLVVPRRLWVGPAIGWAAAAAVGIWLGTLSAPDEQALPASGDPGYSGALVEEEALELARGSFEGLEELQ